MKNSYPCDVIRDLLPGYIDHILSEAGTDAVREHLEECGACRQVYRDMEKEPEEGAGTQIGAQEQLVLDGMKKVRRRTKRLRITAGTVSAVLLLMVVSFFLKFYVIGMPLSTSDITPAGISYDEDTGALTVSGVVNLASTRICRVLWEQSEEDENAVNILVYTADTLPFQKEKTDFEITVPDMKGKKAYLACPDYDQFEIYNWKYGHYDKLDALEDEIYGRLAELDRARDVLCYSGGIETVDGAEGICFSVDTVIGEDASYWWFNDHLVTDGDLEPRRFEVWISYDEPYRILLYDYETGGYTEDYSVIGDR